MSVSDILLTLILSLAPSFRGLYREQEMFVFQTAVFVSFLFFLYQRRRLALKLNRLPDIAVFALATSYLVSLFGAADLREALLAVMRITSYLMLYIMIAAKAREKGGRGLILRTVYMSGVIAVVVNGLNLAGLITTSLVWDGGIIQTTFEYKNAGAMFFLICTLIGIYLGGETNSVKTKVLIGTANYLNLLIIIGTQSRAVWLLGSAAYILLLTGIAKDKRDIVAESIIPLIFSLLIGASLMSLLRGEMPAEAILLALLGAVLTAGGTYGWLWLNSRSQIANRRSFITIIIILVILAAATMGIKSTGVLSRLQTVALSDYSIQERIVFAGDAWKIIREHPLFGAGGRGWDILYLNQQSYGYYAENVHNDFLQLTVETGFMGLTAFIFLWAAFFVTGWRVRHADPAQKNAVWLFTTAGAVILLHALFDFDLAHGAAAFVLWSLFGLMRSLDKDSPEKDSRFPLPLTAAVTVVSSVFIFLSLSFLTGDIFFARGEENLNYGDLNRAREYFQKAQTFDPWKENNLVSLAQINLALYENGDPSALDQALDFAEKAIRARPNEPLSHSVYGAALFYKGDYSQSAAETEKFVSLHPMLLAAYEELAARYVNVGIALKEQGKAQEARGYLDKVQKVPGMINERLEKIPVNEIELWRANKSEPVLSVTPRINLYVGAAKMLTGNGTRGSALILKAAEADADNPDALLWQALALDLTGQKDRARTLIEQAAAQNPGVVQNYNKIRKML